MFVTLTSSLFKLRIAFHNSPEMRPEKCTKIQKMLNGFLPTFSLDALSVLVLASGCKMQTKRDTQTTVSKTKPGGSALWSLLLQGQARFHTLAPKLCKNPLLDLAKAKILKDRLSVG